MVKTNVILLLVNLVFGAYLLNKGLKFFEPLPEAVLAAENIIFVVAGGLLILAGFLSMRAAPDRR